MAQKASTLRSRLLGEDRPTKQRMVEALESRLEATETVEYQLTSNGSLTHDEMGGDTYERGSDDGGLLLAVTDRKLVFVVDTRSGLETADIPYTDVKDVTADSGILRTTLSVRVWGRGTYSFRPAQRETAKQVDEFATKGSRSWDRVVAALQDARQHILTIETYVHEGRMDDAREAEASVESNLQTAETRIDDASQTFQTPLEERYERVETELDRTWMEARFERGQDLLEAATVRPKAGQYNEAAATLLQAREHFERALSLAVEDGFDLDGEIQSALSELQDRIEDLESHPLDLAEESLERAQAADSPERAVVAWEDTFRHYREALVSGWGMPIDFDGEKEALRAQVEWAAANVVRERCRLADRLEATAGTHREADRSQQAADHYRGAAAQVVMARRLATQFQAGDADALAARLEDLRAQIAD
ncbi:PH domain-containing protein [Salinibaculum rarum]|uniref:PH domain-containing protein n=1 Tax=Salinibaculum rarum TaxID=3058903 RepID=UPI00265FC99B|nr:PH domain-containing protein [Salinibaculum sp. KK48]